jgi:hypothetical protein
MDSVSKWKTKVNPASLYTTTSKYVGWFFEKLLELADKRGYCYN